MLNTNTIQSLIVSGEGYNVEFKVRVPSKVRELTEEICAFANADEQAIKDFRTEAQLSPSTADNQIFENLELFTDKGVAKNGAAMFFGKEPERKFPHAITRCVLFKGTTKVYIIDDKSFGGPLYQQYLQAMAWLESKLQVAYKIEGPGPREEIWEIPLTVFKEAVINALSHRDYYEQGATITIEMFDDRVEVSNPGGLLPIVARDFGHKSMTRNPLIFGLFTRMHLVERVASGIPRMQEAMKKAKLPEPEFHTDGMFTVVFKRQITNSANYDTVNGRVNDIVNDTINENEQAIFDLLATTPGLNASEISKHICKSLRTVMRYIKLLQEKDLIEFRGAPKTGGYFLKHN